MNNAKAKFILRSYRSSGEDARDPAFREALEQADRDPGLKGWLQREMELDDVIRTRLAGVPAPASLLDDILATQVVTTARTFRRYSRRLAMAAAIVMLAAGTWITVYHVQPALSHDAFPRMASSFLSKPFQLEHTAGNLEDARAWLHARNVAWDIPATDAMETAATSGIGCRPIQWKGREVYLFCFFLEDGNVVHYFIMETDALPDARTGEPPLWARHGQYTTVSWADERYTYVLAGKGEISGLQALL